ncbi:hypothetical protein E5F05_04875 (plasmid) [Deinococcus metallilatus]|uniref:Uncharacterized protein n=1 Tax=Deinococcus metallilatus TaxID=1211322 RepID=A0AAJ5JZK6_9DEIO|nr:hypothetical protein E5F05_04875 [Deinococcus metallilatus]RXJ14787.1 hypothetical protein ERJ73_03595 [Deinococcus metallilatus]TLK30908.1 hypothetical protein FCS05_03910 [Deinococcus metallilatus]
MPRASLGTSWTSPAPWPRCPYGAAQGIAVEALPGNTGLRVGTEATGYNDDHGARLTTFHPGWRGQPIRRMGADAAKLLVYYHPARENAAARQREVTAALIAACREEDLPALVEPVASPGAPRDEDPAGVCPTSGRTGGPRRPGPSRAGRGRAQGGVSRRPALRAGRGLHARGVQRPANLAVGRRARRGAHLPGGDRGSGRGVRLPDVPYGGRRWAWG